MFFSKLFTNVQRSIISSSFSTSFRALSTTINNNTNITSKQITYQKHISYNHNTSHTMNVSNGINYTTLSTPFTNQLHKKFYCAEAEAKVDKEEGEESNDNTSSSSSSSSYEWGRFVEKKKRPDNLFDVALRFNDLGVGKKFTRTKWRGYNHNSYWVITRVVPKKAVNGIFTGKAWGVETYKGRSDGKVRRIRSAHKRQWRLLLEHYPFHAPNYQKGTMEPVEKVIPSKKYNKVAIESFIKDGPKFSAPKPITLSNPEPEQVEDDTTTEESDENSTAEDKEVEEKA